jgi:hypothetical protein
LLGNVPKCDKSTHFICFDYIEIDGIPSVICHLDIHKWNKTTKPEILEDIQRVAEEEPLPKYVVWDGKDKKFLKFITMVGFVDSGRATEDYGDVEYLYIWSKE